MLYRNSLKLGLVIMLVLESLVFLLAPPTLAQENNDPKESCKRLEDRFKAVNPEKKNAVKPEELTIIFPRYCTVSVVVRRVLNILFTLSGVVAVLFIVIGGFQYMASAGNQEIADKGKKTLTYAVIGLIVIILATTIVNITVNLLIRG